MTGVGSAEHGGDGVTTRWLLAVLTLVVVVPLAALAITLIRGGEFRGGGNEPAANLVGNGDFESTSDGVVPLLNFGSVVGFGGAAAHGQSGLIVRAAAAGDTRVGFGKLDGSPIGVSPGATYTASAFVKSVIDPHARLSVGIRWLDGHGRLIDDVVGAPATIPGPGATRIARTSVAPAGAESAIPFVRYASPGPAAGFGVDNVRFVRRVRAR